ncbi:hypothetical protein B0H14DRAFT_2594805 [Mycena olivaceomarginata]|nr:hypothetical protein B0H14DRAFT_2594805 [Mycena olivaceomarginata]
MAYLTADLPSSPDFDPTTLAMPPTSVIREIALALRIREWDLSYECLISPRIRKRLRDEESQNTVFWQELQASRANRGLPLGIKNFVEDDEDQDDEGPDDSDVAVAAVIAYVANKRKGRVARKPAVEGGGLRSAGLAKDLEAGAEPAPDSEDNGEPAPGVEMTESADAEEGGRGKRIRKKNRRYLGWLQHDDEDAAATATVFHGYTAGSSSKRKTRDGDEEVNHFLRGNKGATEIAKEDKPAAKKRKRTDEAEE